MRTVDQKKIFRLIDANMNRAKEGLRVCEDIARFVLDDKSLTRKYKNLRHALTEGLRTLKKNQKSLLLSRDIKRDVGRDSTHLELKRNSIEDVFYANSQRAKESIRVLEEFVKLLGSTLAANHFKKLRYKTYLAEQDLLRKMKR